MGRVSSISSLGWEISCVRVQRSKASHARSRSDQAIAQGERAIEKTVNRAIATSLLFLSLWFAPVVAHAAKLYVVYASISGTQSAGWVAQELGLFGKNGLDVELLFAGGGRAVTSLLAGNTPIVTVGGPSAIAARLSGGGFTLIPPPLDHPPLSFFVVPHAQI